MARTRNKIKYCYEDYLRHATVAEMQEYQEKFAPLQEIIAGHDGDRAIMAAAREYDATHGTDLFSAAVQLTVYCIACHKFDCDC